MSYCNRSEIVITKAVMKNASLPSLRVQPMHRKSAEEVLRQGEIFSSFIEASLRANIERRLSQKEFIARGLASQERILRAAEYEDAHVVVEHLQKMLLAEKKKRS
jgi:hypothetical protein